LNNETQGTQRKGLEKTLLTLRFISLIFLLEMSAACVPAERPKFLENTPGPPVEVVGEVYDAEAFTLRYPAGWTVVSSPANQPAAVTLVAPDESATIRVSVHPDLEVSPDEDLPNGMRLHVEQMSLERGLTATISLGAPIRQWEALIPVYDAVKQSIRAGQIE
jgi:hypothetical protein